MIGLDDRYQLIDDGFLADRLESALSWRKAMAQTQLFAPIAASAEATQPATAPVVDVAAALAPSTASAAGPDPVQFDFDDLGGSGRSAFAHIYRPAFELGMHSGWSNNGDWSSSFAARTDMVGLANDGAYSLNHGGWDAFIYL